MSNRYRGRVRTLTEKPRTHEGRSLGVSDQPSHAGERPRFAVFRRGAAGLTSEQEAEVRAIFDRVRVRFPYRRDTCEIVMSNE